MDDLFDPALAAEFRARPRGRHSPALHRLLSIMRLPENCLDLMIVATVPHKEWMLAEGGVEGGRPRPLPGIFRSLADAECSIFRRRWHALGGPELPDETD